MPVVSTIIGRLGRDPQNKTTKGDYGVTEVTVASDHGWGDRKTTTWIRCTFWGKRGEQLTKHFAKGDRIAIVGHVWLDTYTKKDGSQGYSVECDAADWHFVESKGSSPKPNMSMGTDASQFQQDEEIPF